MVWGLPDFIRFSTVPASLNLLIMSDIVDLGCCKTLAMSDIFSPFLKRLMDHGFSRRVCRKKVVVKFDNRKKRLAWCREKRWWTT
jgi:hypothetical protein